MKKVLILLFVFTTMTSIAQNKIEKLVYAKMSITIPEQCIAESESKISDCNGFSAMWFTIESAGSGMRKRTLKQIEEKVKFKTKDDIKFTSQNQLFEGATYELEDGAYRIVGFGKINEMPLMIILGFKTKISSNSDLKEFEKNFITFI